MSKHFIILAIVLFRFAFSFHLNSNKCDTFQNDSSTFDVQVVQPNKNVSVSLNQFHILKELGEGMFSVVYLASKNEGPDNGQLYALKVMSIDRALELEKMYKTNCLDVEREILEMAREWPFAVGLIYAWRQGNYLFLVMDFVSGGTVSSKIENKRQDANTAKLFIAETVSIFEQLHANGVLHSDVKTTNLLIQSDGHLSIADFGLAKKFDNINDTKIDWEYVYYMWGEVLSCPITNEHEKGIRNMLKDMTDANLADLKSHTYFDGIDWEKVAARESDPPFEPIGFQLNEDNRIDLVAELQSGLNAELDETVLERLRDYTFIAPNLQH